MNDELHFLTIAEAAELNRTRKLSPLEYTEALIKRTEAISMAANSLRRGFAVDVSQ